MPARRKKRCGRNRSDSLPGEFEVRISTIVCVFTDRWSLARGLVLALIIGAAPSIALAQDAEPTPAQLRAAAEAFDRGREAYKAEHFAEAAEQFERADASAPSATALDLAMKARDRAGDLDRAGTLAALGLERYPDDPNIAAAAPEIIQRARAQLYEVTVACVIPCELADGTQIVHGTASQQRTVFLTPGQHSLRAGFPDGKTQSKSLDAMAGMNGQLSFEGPAPEQVEPVAAPEPEPEPEPEAPPPEESSKGWSPMVFWIGAGATVVAGGVTAWSGIDTINNPGKDRVQNECAAHDEDCELYQQGRSKQARTNVLLGVTGGLAVATGLIGVLAVDWGGKSPAGADARVKPHIKPYFSVGDGFSLGARGRF
jgi:hypothetical protein